MELGYRYMPVDITLMFKLAGTTLKNSRIRASCFTSFVNSDMHVCPCFAVYRTRYLKAVHFCFASDSVANQVTFKGYRRLFCLSDVLVLSRIFTHEETLPLWMRGCKF